MDLKDRVDQYIEDDPDHPGASRARLHRFGVSVWALVAYYQAANGDIDRVAADYALPREAVEAALAYYGRHRNAIDARIEEHQAAFV